MDEPKTSTFTIHHDRCKPEEWGPRDILKLADFIRTGDMKHAAALSRLGVQLVLSEHHEPKGGDVQQVAFATPGLPDGDIGDLDDIACDEDVTPVVRVYSGPVEYAARFAIGDGEGNIDGHEFEMFKTQDEADAFIRSLYEDAA